GATITGEGVNKMLNSGLAVYIPYFNHVEKK
ncbi:MAG TPA: NADH:ubiquinone reductase (Na(+)-transporting) subunit C, partial [Saprospiraceae bacterium]|nr:NADH:ubiquinone reductase (Na(+)-transporting) subunit C [Saprospiraceae bacterium]